MPYPKLSPILHNCAVHALTPELKEEILKFSANEAYDNKHRAEYLRLKNHFAIFYGFDPKEFTWKQFADILNCYNPFDTQILLGPVLRSFMKETISHPNLNEATMNSAYGLNISRNDYIKCATEIGDTGRYMELGLDEVSFGIAMPLGLGILYKTKGVDDGKKDLQEYPAPDPIASIEVFHQDRSLRIDNINGHWERTDDGKQSVNYQNDSRLGSIISLFIYEASTTSFALGLLKQHVQLTAHSLVVQDNLTENFKEIDITAAQIQQYLFNITAVPKTLAVKLLGTPLTELAETFIKGHQIPLVLQVEPNDIYERWYKSDAYNRKSIESSFNEDEKLGLKRLMQQPPKMGTPVSVNPDQLREDEEFARELQNYEENTRELEQKEERAKRSSGKKAATEPTFDQLRKQREDLEMKHAREVIQDFVKHITVLPIQFKAATFEMVEEQRRALLTELNDISNKDDLVQAQKTLGLKKQDTQLTNAIACKVQAINHAAELLNKQLEEQQRKQQAEQQRKLMEEQHAKEDKATNVIHYYSNAINAFSVVFNDQTTPEQQKLELRGQLNDIVNNPELIEAYKTLGINTHPYIDQAILTKNKEIDLAAQQEVQRRKQVAEQQGQELQKQAREIEEQRLKLEEENRKLEAKQNEIKQNQQVIDFYVNQIKILPVAFNAPTTQSIEDQRLALLQKVIDIAKDPVLLNAHKKLGLTDPHRAIYEAVGFKDREINSSAEKAKQVQKELQRKQQEELQRKQLEEQRVKKLEQNEAVKVIEIYANRINALPVEISAKTTKLIDEQCVALRDQLNTIINNPDLSKAHKTLGIAQHSKIAEALVTKNKEIDSAAIQQRKQLDEQAQQHADEQQRMKQREQDQQRLKEEQQRLKEREAQQKLLKEREAQQQLLKEREAQQQLLKEREAEQQRLKPRAEEPHTINEYHQEFNKAIALLQQKMDKFRDKPKFADAYNAAEKLYNDLDIEGNIYFNKTPSKAAFDSFRSSCQTHIREARQVLDKNRGWAKILLNVAAMILTAGVGYAVAAGINLIINKGKFTFFSTDSSLKIDEIEHNINKASPSA